jgi:hypothetical protein
LASSKGGAVAYLDRLSIGLLQQEDRHGDVARLRLDDPFGVEALRILGRVFLELQHDPGAMRGGIRKLGNLDAVGPKTVRRPMRRGIPTGPRENTSTLSATMNAE